MIFRGKRLGLTMWGTEPVAAMARHASAAADHAAIMPDSLVDHVILNPQIVGPGAKPLDVVLRELETQVLPYL